MARARHVCGSVRFVPFIIVVMTTVVLPFRFPWQEEKSGGPEQNQTREVAPTYLDTLNRDNELHVSGSDFEKSPPADAGAKPAKENPSASPAKAPRRTAIGQFRIQCMASQSLDGVRKEKQQMEQELGLPLYIVYSPPFYRLHAGAFESRDEAEKHLGRVRKNGYPEAWVVKSDAEPVD